VAREFNVDRKCIRDWVEKRERIESEADTQREKLPGGGRKLTSDELDEILFESFIDKRINGIRVTRSEIKHGERSWQQKWMLI
jgi:hypothetical protein